MTNKAEYLVHWPSQPILACTEHMQKLVSLGGVMGTHVGVTPYDGEGLCANCVNERRKAADPQDRRSGDDPIALLATGVVVAQLLSTPAEASASVPDTPSAPDNSSFSNSTGDGGFGGGGSDGSF